MTYALSSLVILTAVFWGLRKAKLFSYCPICAATVLTWAFGLGGVLTGATWVSPMVVAILMGASMGAIAERYGNKFGFIWKTVFVTAGFSAISFLLSGSYWYALGSGVVLFIATAYTAASPQSASQKNLFENCC